MSLSFGQNLSKSIRFANTSFKSFSSWLILLILGLFGLIGSFIVVIGSLLVVFVTCLAFIPEFGEIFGTFSELSGMPLFDIATSVIPSLNILGIVFMIIGLIVALICGFFISGTFVRAARGGEMTLAHPGKLFAEGFLYFVISLIYVIPYIIVSILVNLGPMTNPAYGIIVGVLLPLILLFICLMFGLLGVTAYAKEGKFGAAFNLKKIGSIVGKFGCLRLFGHVLLFYIILAVISLVLVFIPVIGWIVLLLISPFITIVSGRFFGNITESVAE